MPVHHLLEQILKEYLRPQAFEADNPCFRA
jgi:hypothetical protein